MYWCAALAHLYSSLRDLHTPASYLTWVYKKLSSIKYTSVSVWTYGFLLLVQRLWDLVKFSNGLWLQVNIKWRWVNHSSVPSCGIIISKLWRSLTHLMIIIFWPNIISSKWPSLRTIWSGPTYDPHLFSQPSLVPFYVSLPFYQLK